MSTKYSRSSLIRIYRRYVHAIGWADHAMIAEQRVDLWLRCRTQAVEDAIAWHERGAAARSARRRKIVACLTGACLVSAGAALWWTA